MSICRSVFRRSVISGQSTSDGGRCTEEQYEPLMPMRERGQGLSSFKQAL